MMNQIKIFLVLLSCCMLPSNVVFAADCDLNLPEVTRSQSLRIESNNLNLKVNDQQISSSTIQLRKGLNKIVIQGDNCLVRKFIVVAPRLFFRPYKAQSSLEDIKFTKLISNPVGMVAPVDDPGDLSDDLRETGVQLDPDIPLGTVFFAQIVDHDITGNNQFQNGPSNNPDQPENLRTPALDLDNLYGFGRNSEVSSYRKDNLRFKLPTGLDVPRTEDGVALIPDKRDDITGLTLQLHILLKRYHNFLISRFLRGVSHKKLSSKQKRWLFEMVRNEVIGTYQGIVTAELSNALIGRNLSLKFPALNNIPVEFAAAVFRIGHSLVPNQVAVNPAGRKLSPIDRQLRGVSRIHVPWTLLLGRDAQKAARFDDKIAPVMQELIVPLSPNNPALADMVGGSAQNIGSGRVVDGVLRLDLVETNILRSREQDIPSGEEVLALINGASYNAASDGNTDLWVYVLQEAAANNFKYGKVGSFVFESAIAGVLNSDNYSIASRRYSKQDKQRFKRRTLFKIAKKAFSEEF